MKPTKTMRQRLLIAASAAILAIPLWPSTSLGASYRIKATDSDRWKPAHRFILKGDRIVWTNPTDTVHDIYKYRGRWSKGYLDSQLEPGERHRKRFKRTGNYYFRCLLHSSMADGQCQGMCGIIHVTRN